MITEITMLLEAIIIFVAGICALLQVFEDKNEPIKAFYLVFVGTVILIAGCLAVFKDEQLGIAAMLIGAIVVVVAAVSNVKDWQTHEAEGVKEGAEGQDLVCAVIGILCIAVSIIGYTVGASGIFLVALVCLGLIAAYLAYTQKETAAIGIYSVIAIILFLVAFSPFIF